RPEGGPEGCCSGRVLSGTGSAVSEYWILEENPMNSLRLTLLLSLLLSVLSTFDAPARADTTVSCTAVKDKANVGVHDDISVNMTTGNNICNFSVSGATVNGTQAQDFNA